MLNHNSPPQDNSKDNIFRQHIPGWDELSDDDKQKCFKVNEYRVSALNLPPLIHPECNKVDSLFSFYRAPISNIMPSEQWTIYDMYKAIKDLNSYSDVINKLRASEHPKEIKNTELDYVTPGGIFKKRANNQLIEPSGLMVIDIDKINNPEKIKQRLINDEKMDVVLAFISPSGNGLKVIVKIDHQQHAQSFNGYQVYLLDKHNITIDDGKDIARACYLSHDKQVFYSKEMMMNKVLNFNPLDYTKNTEINFQTDKTDKTDTYINTEKTHLPSDIENVKSNIVRLIQNSIDGEKHNVLLKASRLIGGAIGGKMISENDGYNFLLNEIKKKTNIDSLGDAITTIQKGIKNGIESPLYSDEFPKDVFPLKMQEIINATNECLLFPVDFIGSSLLFAISVSIANTHRVRVKNGWSESALLYMAIVGNPGTNKSHPLDFALKPIEIKETQNYQQYQSEKKEYDQNQSLSIKQGDKRENINLYPPKWKQHLVTDFTNESLVEILKHNKRGVGVYTDELKSWINNFNRYNKGSDEQFWLSAWSSKSIRVNRKTSEPIFIQMPFISVCGTIQPGVICEIAKGRVENGFMDRLLFVMPNNLKKKCWSETELNPNIIAAWQTIILKLLNIPMSLDNDLSPEPITLDFSKNAKKKLFDWNNEITKRSNETNDESLKGIYEKMESYTIRLSLCLELAHYSCGESNRESVGIKSVEGAIKLIEYFICQSLKVKSLILKGNNSKQLNDLNQKVLNALPDVTFKTSKAVEIAKGFGMEKRNLERFLTSDNFTRMEHGKYKKT